MSTITNVAAYEQGIAWAVHGLKSYTLADVVRQFKRNVLLPGVPTSPSYIAGVMTAIEEWLVAWPQPERRPSTGMGGSWGGSARGAGTTAGRNANLGGGAVGTGSTTAIGG